MKDLNDYCNNYFLETYAFVHFYIKLQVLFKLLKNFMLLFRYIVQVRNHLFHFFTQLFKSLIFLLLQSIIIFKLMLIE